MKVDKETLTKVMNAIIEGANQKAIEENPEIYQTVKEIVEKLPEGDLEEIYFHYIYNIERCLDALKIPFEVQMILVHWPLFKEQVAAIIQKYEGSCCCIDKAKFILRRYIASKINGENFYLSDNKEYFACPATWTGEESYKWEKLIDGLVGLFYGHISDVASLKAV